MTNPVDTIQGAQSPPNNWDEDPLNYTITSFIAFLQTVFESAPVGCLRWTDNIDSTELIITEENPFNPDAYDGKPAISVLLGATKFNASSLDDLVDVRATDGSEVHTDLLPCTVTLNCLSKVPVEARRLGWLCARHVWILRKLFIRNSRIHETGRNISVSPVSPAGALVGGDTEGEWHVCGVTIPVYLQWTDTVTCLTEDWTGRPISPLNDIKLRLTSRINGPTTTFAGKQLGGLVEGVPTAGVYAAQSKVNTRQRQMGILKPATINGRVLREVTTVPLGAIEQETKI